MSTGDNDKLTTGDSGKLPTGDNDKLAVVVKEMKLTEESSNGDVEGEEDLAALDKELDNLSSALDQIESWSNSLHGKVAELLKETREQNQNKTKHVDEQLDEPTNEKDRSSS